MIIELALVALTLLVSPTAGFLLRNHFPNWSRWRIAVVGALPIPALLWLICAILFVSSAMASEKACGVDACAMTMMASVAVAGMAVFVLLASLPLAAVGAYFAARRTTPRSAAREFE